MDVVLVYLEEAAKSLDERLPLVEFPTTLCIRRQLGDYSEQIEDQVVAGWEHLDEAGPGLKAVAFQEDLGGPILSSQVPAG